MSKIKTEYILITVSLAVISIIIASGYTSYHRTYGYPENSAIFPTDYLSLFNKNAKTYLSGGASLKQGSRNPITTVFYNQPSIYNYGICIFKIGAVKNFIVSHHDEGFDLEDNIKDYFEYPDKFDFYYRNVCLGDSIRQINLDIHGASKGIENNDSQFHYFGTLNSISITYNNEKYPDFYLRSKQGGTPVNFLFIKKNGFLYFLIMCNNRDRDISDNLLKSLLKDGD